MVRVSTAVAFVLAFALGVQASAICQCLFADGSHCCVYVNANGPAEDCTVACRDKHRSTGNVACNANGRWSKVSAWNAQWRTGCAR